MIIKTGIFKDGLEFSVIIPNNRLDSAKILLGGEEVLFHNVPKEVYDQVVDYISQTALVRMLVLK